MELSHRLTGLQWRCFYFNPNPQLNLGVKFNSKTKYNFPLNYLFKIMHIIHVGIKNKLPYDLHTSPMLEEFCS